MRTPFQEAREHDGTRLRTQLADGLRFLWGQPFLRTTSAIYGIGNFMVPAVVLTLVVSAATRALGRARPGLLLALFGVATVAGSLPSPLVPPPAARARDPLLELWSWLCVAGSFVAHPDAYVLAAACVPLGVALPVTDSVVVDAPGRTDARPPARAGQERPAHDRARHRPARPADRGAPARARSRARATVAVFAAIGLGLALWGTLSPAIRLAPRLDQTRRRRGPTQGLKVRVQTPMYGGG